MTFTVRPVGVSRGKRVLCTVSKTFLVPTVTNEKLLILTECIPSLLTSKVSARHANVRKEGLYQVPSTLPLCNIALMQLVPGKEGLNQILCPDAIDISSKDGKSDRHW